MTKPDRGQDAHQRFHTLGTLFGYGFDIYLATWIRYEFLGFPAFARQLHGNYAVRAAEPLYVRPDHDWEYRRDFDRLTALDQVRLHVLTNHRSEESKGVP